MSCHLSITMHNMMPDKPSEGVHVPFHTIIMNPFRRPFTFGPQRCDVKDGSHIGLESEMAVAANFVGDSGQFLVMSPNQFVILKPKPGIPISIGCALFPKESTHIMYEAEKAKSYPVTVGTSILAYNFDLKPSLKSITIFMGSDSTTHPKDDVYRSTLGAMAQSLLYFNSIWKAIAKEKTIFKEEFKPEAVSREKYPDMKVLMNVFCKPALELVKSSLLNTARGGDSKRQKL